MAYAQPLGVISCDGVLEALDRFVIFISAGGDHEVLVVDFVAIAEVDNVGLRVDTEHLGALGVVHVFE